jgi:hypothetical protein
MPAAASFTARHQKDESQKGVSKSFPVKPCPVRILKRLLAFSRQPSAFSYQPSAVSQSRQSSANRLFRLTAER